MDFTFLASTMVTLLKAVPTTLILFSLSIFFGGLLALVIVTMRVSGNRYLSGFAKGYIFVFRGSPLLIQMFLVFYGLGQFGVIRYSFLWPFLREPMVCAVLSLALCTAGYTAEIFRGGIRAVSPKEIEAARSIGMSGFLMVRRILAPIAFRHALPGLFHRDRADDEVDGARQPRHRLGGHRCGPAADLANLPHDGSLPLRGDHLSRFELHHPAGHGSARIFAVPAPPRDPAGAEGLGGT